MSDEDSNGPFFMELFKKKFGLENDYPLIEYKGSIKYCSSFEEISCAAQEILDWVKEQTYDKVPIAFDMEWTVNYTKNALQGRTALIQLCAKLDECFLFHVVTIKKLPEALITLLLHSKVILHGNRIKSDLVKLQKDFPGVFPDTIIEQCKDLGVWCHEVCDTTGSWSMKNLVPYMCKLRIDKNDDVRTGNWDVFPLSGEQQKYAAIDVYIALDIYNKLKDKNDANIARFTESIRKIGIPDAMNMERKRSKAAKKDYTDATSSKKLKPNKSF